MTKNLPSEGSGPEPPAHKPEQDLPWWSLGHPTTTRVLAALGLLSLLLSIVSGLASWNSWSLLAAAVVCAILAFPRFIANHIESIKLPGGSGVTLREASPGPTRPGAPGVGDLAGQAPTSLSDKRLLLAQLRTAGVALRNRGSQLDRDELQSWLAEVKQWSDATANNVERVDPADAEWFRTLDAVPPPRIRYRPINGTHAKAYREFDFMLEKLEALITRYAERGRPRNEAPMRGEEFQ